MAEATSRSTHSAGHGPDSHDRIRTRLIRYNTISFCADAASLANPDSFLETNFHAVDALDVDNCAAIIHSRLRSHRSRPAGNHLADNHVDRMFIRISTAAGDRLGGSRPSRDVGTTRPGACRGRKPAD